MGECPRFLYKYRQAVTDPTRKLLEQRQLWFATPTTLNDPYDCRAYFTLAYTDAELEEQAIELEAKGGRKFRNDFLAAMKDPEQRANSELGMQAFNDKIAERLGVCCFSESPAIATMWAHYADSHRGICVEIDMIQLPKENRDKTFPVMYTSDRPIVKTGYSYERSLEIVTTKSIDWSQEKEWRALLRPNFAFPVPESAISAVIFGVRTTKEDETTVRQWLQDRDTPVSFRRARLAPREYRIEIIDA